MTKSPRPSPIQTALARSGVLICLCASAFTHVGSLIVAGTVPLLLVAYAGIVATASYAVDRLADSYSSIRRDRMGVAVACLVAVWPLTRGDYLLAALSAAFPLLMVPYATVKRVPLLKAPYVALGWTGLLGFPCIASARVQGFKACALPRSSCSEKRLSTPSRVTWPTRAKIGSLPRPPCRSFSAELAHCGCCRG
jgi:hypothetical protein